MSRSSIDLGPVLRRAINLAASPGTRRNGHGRAAQSQLLFSASETSFTRPAWITNVGARSSMHESR